MNDSKYLTRIRLIIDILIHHNSFEVPWMGLRPISTGSVYGANGTKQSAETEQSEYLFFQIYISNTCFSFGDKDKVR